MAWFGKQELQNGARVHGLRKPAVRSGRICVEAHRMAMAKLNQEEVDVDGGRASIGLHVFIGGAYGGKPTGSARWQLDFAPDGIGV